MITTSSFLIILTPVILVRADSSELVTKEPVAPESKMAYILEDWGGTKTRPVEV